MTHEEFDKLVARVESGIGRDTRALYWRIFRLALLGYAGLLLPLTMVVLISLAFFLPGILDPKDAGPLVIIGACVLVLGGWVTGKMLWIRLAPPKGRTVTRAEAPALFAALDDLRRRQRSAAFDEVLIIPAYNAAFAHRPRLGVFGWSRTYLLAGLPMMETLSKDEFIAVLAHECAHLSRQHHHSGQWVYRLRRSWEQVFAGLTRPRRAGEISLRPVARKFVGWFWPRFNAHAFVLSRAQEYQADAAAGEMAGVPNMAHALIRIAWLGRVLDAKVWPELWGTTGSRTDPPENVFKGIADSLNAATPETEGRLLEQAFSAATTNADTHPCLSDRLRALGMDARFQGRESAPPAPGPANAAEALLGTALAKIRADVEQAWRSEAEPRWRQLHGRANILHERLDKLDATMAGRQEDRDALWDKARVFLELHQPEAAAPLLRQVLAIDPHHAAANFNLGAFLLKSGDTEGEQFLERAVAEDEEVLPRVANELHAHFRQSGQSDRLRELYARMDRHEKSIVASREERTNVTAADTLVAHELTEAELAALRAVLSAEADVLSANLARKELKHFVKQKLYLLCVRVRPAWHRLPDADRQQAVIGRLTKTVRVPGRVLIFTGAGELRGVARKLRRAPGSLVYTREKAAKD